MVETLPLWGQFSIIGFLLSIIGTVLFLWFKGEIVSRKQLEQVQKIADTFQKAWEVETKRGEVQAETLNRLVVIGETTLRLVEAKPPHMHTPGAPTDVA